MKRAARALIGWEQQRLAAAKVNPSTLNRMEKAGDKTLSAISQNLERILNVLAREGVESPTTGCGRLRGWRQLMEDDVVGYAIRGKVADLRVETVGTTIVHLVANTTRGGAWLEMYVDLEDPPIFDANQNCGMIVLTIHQLPGVLDEARLAGLTIGGEPR